MNRLSKNILPVEVIFHPSWWYRNAGITFDDDFFYHPLKRVESERMMEKELYERFGEFGSGKDRDKDLPVIGAVHNAAGYILSEMLGCRVEYEEDKAPQVYCAHRDDFEIDIESAFLSAPFKKISRLIDELKTRFGYVCGDINWGGILNLALDLKGENILVDMMMDAETSISYFKNISLIISKFTKMIEAQTGTTSISVNRIVRHLNKPVFLHSECSHTMIPEDLYEQHLMPFDREWSMKYRPFGIHYCGKDPHRFAESFSKIPHLDFLDVGWGGDVKRLREKLPDTFFSIRLDPVTIRTTPDRELESIIRKLITDSGDFSLTGICCVNIDGNTDDSKIRTIFRTVESIKKQNRQL
jgi:hypothetical protein